MLAQSSLGGPNRFKMVGQRSIDDDGGIVEIHAHWIKPCDSNSHDP